MTTPDITIAVQLFKVFVFVLLGLNNNLSILYLFTIHDIFEIAKESIQPLFTQGLRGLFRWWHFSVSKTTTQKN